MNAPLTEPMRLVLECVSNKGNPTSLYSMGQLRMILQGLSNRGLIVRRENGMRAEWHLTPAGRNYVTQHRNRTQ